MRRATLQGPQDLADGFAVVVGRAAHQTLLFGWAELFLGRAELFLGRAELFNGRGGGQGAPRRLRAGLFGRRHLRGGGTGGFRPPRVARRARILDRRKRRCRRVLDLLRSVCHVRRRLVSRWTRAAAGTDPDRATSAFSLEIPSGTPSGSRQSRAAQTIHRRSAILSAWHTEG